MSSLFEPHERERLLEGLLAWIAAHLRFFDPPQEDEVFDVAPENIGQCRRRKAFGELGAALRLAARSAELWQRAPVRRLARQWQEMAVCRNVFFDPRRRVHLFPARCVALAALEAFGAAPSSVRAALQNVLAGGFMDRVERSAWQKIDLKYYVEAAGLRHSFPPDEELLAQSSLMSPPALPRVQDLDLYGITHLVFHLTDFGRRDLAPLLGDRLPALCDYVELALAMSLAADDWDLTAELLMTRLHLGRWEGPLGHEAAQALCEAQTPAGFVPDRRRLEGPFPGTGEQQAEAEFFAVYHPTLVSLFLLCCDTTTSRLPSSR